LLPLSYRPACWPGGRKRIAASKLAGKKRQQAAALQSSAEEFAEFDEFFHAFVAAEADQPGPLVLQIKLAKRVRDVLERRHGQRRDYTANLTLNCNTVPSLYCNRADPPSAIEGCAWRFRD